MFLVPMTRNASELARSFDRLFDDGFERFFAPSTNNNPSRSPALDVSESDSAYTVKLDLPGVAKEDVKVSIDGRRVSVRGQGSGPGQDAGKFGRRRRGGTRRQYRGGCYCRRGGRGRGRAQDDGPKVGRQGCRIKSRQGAGAQACGQWWSQAAASLRRRA